MNQTFSLPRFGRLLYKYLSDNRGQLLTSLALLMGIMLIGLVVFYRGLPFQVDRNRGISLFFFGWPLWFIFTWQQTEVLNHRERAMSYLLQPASQFEKFLLIWLVSGVGFLAVYLLLFAVSDALGVAYINGRNWNPDQLRNVRSVDGIMSIKPFYDSQKLWPPTHIVVLTGLLHPFCLAAFLLVKRYSLPVVGVLVLMVLAAGYFVNFYTVQAFLAPAKVVSVLPLENATVNLPSGNGYRDIILPQPLTNVFRYVTGVAGVLLLYVIAFFRLKEREV